MTRKPEVVTVGMTKGGVGKTFISLNLAGGLSDRGHKVLLIDSDPQGSLTTNVVGKGPYTKEKTGNQIDTLSEAMLDDWSEIRDGGLDRLIFADESVHEEFDFVPSHQSLRKQEIEISKSSRAQARLDELITGMNKSYDFVVVDTTNAKDAYLQNAIFAADQLVMPMAPVSEIESSVTTFRRLVKTMNMAHGTSQRPRTYVMNNIPGGNMSRENKQMIEWFESNISNGIKVRKRAAFKRGKWDTKRYTIYQSEEARSNDQFEQFDKITSRVVQQAQMSNPTAAASSKTVNDD